MYTIKVKAYHIDKKTTPAWSENLFTPPGRVLDKYLGIGEPLRFWNHDPVKDKKIPKIYTLFSTTPSILLPCLRQRKKCMPSCFHVIVTAFVYLEYKENSFSKSNQSCRLTDSHEITYPVYDRLTRNYIPSWGQRSQKPYPIHWHIHV